MGMLLKEISCSTESSIRLNSMALQASGALGYLTRKGSGQQSRPTILGQAAETMGSSDTELTNGLGPDRLVGADPKDY